MASSTAPLPFPQLTTIAHRALTSQDGSTLALLLSTPLSALTPDQETVPRSILSALTNSSERFLNPQAARLPEPWKEVFVGHVQVLVLIQQGAFAAAAAAASAEGAATAATQGGGDASWDAAYKKQSAIVSAYLTKHLAHSPSWSLPALYVLLRTLRALALKADAFSLLSPSTSQTSWVRSEETARTTMKAFTLCATDRAFSGPQARQRGVYYLAGTLVKSYFALGRPSLCANLIRAVSNASNAQPLTSYPKADQTTWSFLMGTLAVLDGKWPRAREDLGKAYEVCRWDAEVQQRQILTLLVPLQLLRGLLPARSIGERHPALERMYRPFVEAVRKADLGAYDLALERSMGWAVDRKVFALLERGREVVVRGVLRKTWVALGRPARVTVGEFWAGLVVAGRAGEGSGGQEGEGEETTVEEVECLLAGMIYKGYMKGYISHAHQTVVLSKVGAFPPLGTRVAAGPE